ncbi:MAG: pyruvate dehydrogenase (acetyl-transferring), homodimeric type [Gammaproteobacteria bacterium]|nr:MAG: pyruvate dehydrogenase (acetyl-transferring), homodimeric type [Gammaproteobacteria bacterium]
MSTETQRADIDAEETQEWLDALEAVIQQEGPGRAHFLLEQLIDKARRSGANLPYDATTAYVNTIPPHLEAKSPGDHELEHKVRAMIRWNAAVMVLRAQRDGSGVGGHIASFASAATLYDVGFNHFFHAPTHEHGGDLLFVQGHSAPGIYARAFLEGRLTAEDLDRFRREADGDGLSSYPHPWLMPDFWQFPTVSMGWTSLCSIYQARFMKYLHDRGLAKTDNRQIWAFLGDGEMDEPESLGAISLAGREKLDNLNFVINCNLQRLDGPVRGNSKIIQELEALFRGAGWNVIKVIWGTYWDPLLARDTSGKLQQLMMETVDGEYQNFKAKGGSYTREHFFGKHPETKALVSTLTDADIWRLNRGGHDPHKLYAAYKAAVEHKGQPTLILAKTVKGYGMGESGEGTNATHQAKKMDIESLLGMRDRFGLNLTDEQVENLEYIQPDPESPEIRYMQERRKALGGYLPQRQKFANQLEVPGLEVFGPLLEGSGDRDMSTTMAFVRMLTILTRDKHIGRHIVPIVPDEARTFGMEGMFRQLGIYSSVGQLYEPQDRDQIMYYKEDKSGQILEEGITEAGAMGSFVAAATSYSTHGVSMIPFYIYYSMFGFQRIGDLAWLAGDMRSRGFMIGGTAGRTTLNGEGLQHEDGHSLVLSNTIPNCVSYDPCYGYEMAVIIQDGMRRMIQEGESVFYYITAMNENYIHPPMPEGAEEGIRKGIYKLRAAGESSGRSGFDNTVRLLGGGTILREVEAAAKMLEETWNIGCDVYSVTSFNELARDGLACERWNMLHPNDDARIPYIEQVLGDSDAPVVSSTDYMKAYSDQVREFVSSTFVTLGTDGFGRSDSREKLREFFEVDRNYVTIAALHALEKDGKLDAVTVAKAIQQYGIDPDRPNPAKA